MTFVVPFDGSELATAALDRAVTLGDALGEPVVAVSVVRRNDAPYARKKGWLDADEPFDLETIVERLREQVAEAAPDAEFRHTTIGRFTTDSEVARAIRGLTREVDATVVFVGSDNAGRIVSSLSSIGTKVATDVAYDVYIVRS
ncbi:Nucleotide-binding universal stress protein, UspA family [Halogranum gelatinilyticum]|uniref:Nucleotide-binding universal stress protein, UspA family n=1 Tax=Halogranum gelatinilyticum TaxID=660521 RepID=A0A1G9XH34_9EURY|nr:universal stress protein [Halogranum gelatinilyticum]SDM95746.1 Nucleotide-binding universal stress protein, UspA family [Halogranum gelatinilyticum]